ncbi:MAG: Gfo/Idh/MocA family oxidoreductase [Planctomycetaceae bacterium]|nr:Gfo/Idh/MocA family oxidoreductase [Planctomycetaceae bacterium]
MTLTRRHLLQAAAAVTASAAVQASPRSAAAPIKVGQIGTGHAHASKLSVYRESPDYEVVGLVEPDASRREQLASSAVYRDVPLMTEEQLLNVPDLQVVLVETEVRDLLATASRCVAAGKHIHLDKPAGESLPEFRQLLAEAQRQQLMIQLGYMYRYNPGVLLLHEFLQQGWLGDLFEIHAVMSKVIAPATRQQLAEYPGGVMFELGCHLIDLVVGLAGRPAAVRPFSATVLAEQDSLPDNMLAVFEYPACLATVKSSAVEVEGFARRHLAVCGTQGTLHMQPLDRPAVRVAFAEPHGDYQRRYQDIELPAYRRYVADAADMARVIRGEKADDFGYEHDLTVQTAVLQASGRPLE